MMAGGAAGAGIGSFVQGLIPAYQAAVQEGLDHNAAVDRAFTTAGVQGGVGAIAGAVGGMVHLLGLKGPGPLASIIARTKGLDPTHSVQEAFAHGVAVGRFSLVPERRFGGIADEVLGDPSCQQT